MISKRGEPIAAPALRDMNDLARHRGPDDSGYHFGVGFAFGHRRLSILDLSQAGHQPMSYQGRYTLTYNGEVYNYLELRIELESLGHRFATRTDTEVILAAWSEWGAKALTRFNGMWAFALHDAAEEKIYLARDRFGVKPLCYCDTEREFCFASEIKQLLPRQPRTHVNQARLIDYLLTHVENHTGESMFRGIMVVPGGCYLEFDLKERAYKTTRYYDLSRQISMIDASGKSSVARFEELLQDSISLRLRSDVTVGTCLSGGIDSSVVSVMASQQYTPGSGRMFKAIHARGMDAEVDESAYAVRVAKHAGLDLSVVRPEQRDFEEQVDEVVYTQEEPFGSPSMFMGWHVFRKARELGCKVMLNGQGGDEVLLGYERYIAPFLSPFRPLDSYSMASTLSRNSGIPLWQVLSYGPYFRSMRFRRLLLRRKSVLRREITLEHDLRYLKASCESFRSVREMQLYEILGMQLPHLLRYEDRNSMRHSIETRLPFLDYRLVEYCLSLPGEEKLGNGWTKLILRRVAEKHLPSDVAWRGRKLGFEAPTRSWFAGHGSAMRKAVGESRILAEVADSKRLVGEYETFSNKVKWSLFNVAVWERVFNVAP